MSKDAMDAITAARLKGVRMVGEAIVASISVPHDKMWHPDFDTAASHTLSPPLRSAAHVAALQAGLAQGFLACVGSDHAAFNSSQKRLGRHDFRDIPVSGNGIEERFVVTWSVLVGSGLAPATRFVEVTSTAAAKMWGLYPRKGHIAAGSDADIVVFDPKDSTTFSAKTHHSAIDTSLWEGYTASGRVLTTVSRGRVVWDAGTLVGIAERRGSGRFVPAGTFGSLYDGLDISARVADATTYPAERYGTVPVKRDGDGGGAPVEEGAGTHADSHAEL